ncbi:MAG: hypothetical protein C0620_03310 [Desulfuromonas sp.]|jgi:prepilin-type N-terminal cleavage/methylation domain-containing protein|nr:MAG: hypothetical protein C0620_03310 [Desulfuromonas sp.]
MHCGNARGFSLLEVIIVIALFAILGAVALPNLLEMGRKDQVKTEARLLKDQLANARATAIENNKTIPVVFAANSYTIDGRQTTLKSTTINPVPANFSWNSRGYPSVASSISIAGEGSTFTITVSLAGGIDISR